MTVLLGVHREVKAIKPYGAFVEIRGMSGLLHISQISFDRVENLPSILDIGMTVKCMIIDHDKVSRGIQITGPTSAHEIFETFLVTYVNSKHTCLFRHLLEIVHEIRVTISFTWASSPLVV